MGFLDKLSESADKVAKQAGKALEQGKTKVEGLQLEMQMDSAAKKLGYLEFDAHRGRAVEQSTREQLLAELVDLEDQLSQKREAAGEKTPAAEAAAGGATGQAGAAQPVAETVIPVESPIPGAEK